MDLKLMLVLMCLLLGLSSCKTLTEIKREKILQGDSNSIGARESEASADFSTLNAKRRSLKRVAENWCWCWYETYYLCPCDD